MKLLVISSSLDVESRSRIMARHAYESLQSDGTDVDWLDLQQTTLPMCDGSSASEQTEVADVSQRIAQARGVLLASPVYNYDLNAAAKNVLELTGKAWSEKVVGFLLAAGGRSSYMSAMGFANSLMLDYRCLILPKFVYATRQAFDGETISDPLVTARIDELAATLQQVTAAVSSVGPSSRT